MCNITTLDDFKNTGREFTVFVIGQEYLNGKGKNQLQQYYNKENWIASDKNIERKIKKTLNLIQQKTPHISELVKCVVEATNSCSKLSILDVIVALSKLFATSEHVAANPDDINPIIIEEENVSKRNLTQYISLYEKCKFTPTIIILLKDDNFYRVEELLSNCPNGINVKIVRSNGTSTYYKVINTGTDDVSGFLDAFSRQCFSTCSRTEHSVLTSSDWKNESIISQFSPTIFQIRSTFIKEHKLEARSKIQWLDDELKLYKPKNNSELILKNSFDCMNKLFRVYCNDSSNTELNEALALAKDLDNEILEAHVYRYSHFFNCSRIEKQELLKEAENIFERHNIADHAIYCRNNRLIHQFSMDKISIYDFNSLKEDAENNTPGLALMAHIFNNVGVANLFEHYFEDAIDILEEGLKYSKNNHIQELALKSNILIAKALYCCEFNENEAKNILRTIFGVNSLGLKRMPFLTAQFALNTIASAYFVNPNIAKILLERFQIVELVQSAFDTNIMGTGSMICQIEVLSKCHKNFDMLERLRLPIKRTPISGIRFEFIQNYGFNPFFFNTWL